MDSLDRPTFTDPSTVSNRAIGLRYGAIWGGASILSSLLGFVSGTDLAMPDAGPMKWVFILLSVAVSIWAMVAAVRADRDQLGGFIGLGRCVGLGAFMGLISGIMGAVYMLLYGYVINPDFQSQMNAAMQAEWEKQGMGEEQIEMASSMAGMFTSPVVMSISQLIGGVIMGVIFGLIVGAIMKRDRPYA